MRIIVNEVNYKAYNFNKKEALAQVFTCVYCETFKNTFSYRTPLVVSSVYCMVHCRIGEL